MSKVKIWVKLSEACELTGVNVKTLHRWIKSEENKEKLRAKQIGRNWYLPIESVKGLQDGSIKITFGGEK